MFEYLRREISARVFNIELRLHARVEQLDQFLKSRFCDQF